jgi:hypothetical protein
MDDKNLDHGSLFDLGDKICDLIDELCGIPQTVILNGKRVEIRVEVTSSLFPHIDIP